MSVLQIQGWPSIHSTNSVLVLRSTGKLPSLQLGRKADPQYN